MMQIQQPSGGMSLLPVVVLYVSGALMLLVEYWRNRSK
jgi:hypothetical protein